MDLYINSYIKNSISTSVYEYVGWNQLRKYMHVPDSVWKKMYDDFCVDPLFKTQLDSFDSSIRCICKTQENNQGKPITQMDFTKLSDVIDEDLKNNLSKRTPYREILIWTIILLIINCLPIVPDILWRNKDFVLFKIKKNNSTFQYIDHSLQSDFDLLSIAVKEYPAALQYTNPVLRADREFMRAMVRQNFKTFEYADHRLKSDRNYVLEIVEINGLALQYVSDILKADADIIITAYKQNKQSSIFASDITILMTEPKYYLNFTQCVTDKWALD